VHIWFKNWQAVDVLLLLLTFKKELQDSTGITQLSMSSW
jgi:hypothetical protein